MGFYVGEKEQPLSGFSIRFSPHPLSENWNPAIPDL